MADLTTNYCNDEDGLSLLDAEVAPVPIQPWWKDAIDTLIEQHTGQGYKGAVKTTTLRGHGGSFLRLPSQAATLTHIAENGTPLPANTYELQDGGRLVERRVSTVWWEPRAVWPRTTKYTVTYHEPTLDQLPAHYRLAAANALATVIMFIDKYKQYGVALTASDAGSAGKVSTAASTSFPSSLLEEIKRIIHNSIKRGRV
jgi:hypothetical protein